MRGKNFWLLIVLLVASLLPYLIICFHTLPFADDFCFAWLTAEKTAFHQKFLNQYLKWNGRYTADLLVHLHPLATGKLIFYRVTMLSSIIATPVILFLFLRKTIDDQRSAILVALFTTLFYLSYLPNQTEGIYWYIGITNYHLGNLCLLLQLLVLLHLTKQKGRNFLLEIASYLLVIISVGFNEIGSILIPIGYLLLLLWATKFRWNSQLLKIHFLVALASAGFVILSPGNQIRSEEFPERYQLFPSIYYASLQTIRFVASWTLNFPFIALSLVLAAHAEKMKNSLPRISYRLIIFCILVMVFTGSFIPYFATGILGQHRTINYVFFFFLLLWPWLVVSLAQRYRLDKRLAFLQSHFASYTVLISIVFVIDFTKGFVPIKDLLSSRFTLYDKEFFERQEELLKNPESKILPLENVPATFQIVDIKADTSFFANKCMRRFYTETKIRLE